LRDIQNEMQDLLDKTVATGKDLGMQLAVYHQGRLIVNAWAGIANAETRKPVTQDTVFPAFSTAKGIAATMLHILAERGALNYEQRISELWPAFARHGKRDVLIKHALSHTAGIPQMPENITSHDLNDWDGMCSRIAELKPLWAPGSHVEYHALTYGWIVGRIIELASKRSFAEFLKQEICDPLGTENLYIGIPGDAMESISIAALYEPVFDAAALNTAGVISIPACCMPMCDWLNRKQTLRACIPAANGAMSALSLARHYASLLPGGVDGVQLLSETTVNKATQVLSVETKPGATNVFGLGYALGVKGCVFGDRPTMFGHGGYGGSVGFADLEHDFAMALTKSYFHKSSMEKKIVRTVQRLLDIPH